MGIKVFGANGSTSTLRVLACLAEKDLEYEFVTVDMPNKEHKKPEFLSRNVCKIEFVDMFRFDFGFWD